MNPFYCLRYSSLNSLHAILIDYRLGHPIIVLISEGRSRRRRASLARARPQRAHAASPPSVHVRRARAVWYRRAEHCTFFISSCQFFIRLVRLHTVDNCEIILSQLFFPCLGRGLFRLFRLRSRIRMWFLLDR